MKLNGLCPDKIPNSVAYTNGSILDVITQFTSAKEADAINERHP